MKRILSYCAVVGSIFLLAGCTQVNSRATAGQQTFTPPELTGQKVENKEIIDLLQRGQPLSCLITKDDNKKHLSLITKNHNIYVTGNIILSSGRETNIIYNQSNIYVWEPNAAVGFSSKLSSPEDIKLLMAKAMQSGVNVPDPTDPETISKLQQDGYVISCSNADVGESVFQAPETTRFIDMSGMVNEALRTVRSPAPSASKTVL